MEHSGNKYHRKIQDINGKELDGVVDVYSVLEAFNVTAPALQHAIKKLLCAGIRGKGDEKQDLSEAIDAIERKLCRVVACQDPEQRINVNTMARIHAFEAENQRLRKLLKTFFYAGGEHGEWMVLKIGDEPMDFDEMLRANGLGEG